jgi:preprotein translocase subunit YajC
VPIGFVLIVLAFLFFYLVFLRPQRRQRVDQARMWQQLSEGDEIVTAGGIYGTITGFDGDDLLVEIAPGLVVKLARRAVAGSVAEPDDELEDADEEEGHELEEGADEEVEEGTDENLTPTAENESYPEGPR